ncbi:MAG: putative sugar nucleotidyl transferase, partial [Planctomycetota bacterium]
MRVCIYEDGYSERLHPLVFIRPVYELRCGMLKLWEKVQRS